MFDETGRSRRTLGEVYSREHVPREKIEESVVRGSPCVPNASAPNVLTQAMRSSCDFIALVHRSLIASKDVSHGWRTRLNSAYSLAELTNVDALQHVPAPSLALYFQFQQRRSAAQQFHC